MLNSDNKNNCNVCSCDFTDDEGGVNGYFGMLPVKFCPTCFSCMIDMAQQYLDISDTELTDEQEEAFDILRGVQHIVINNCHGGFGLSWDAQIAYLDRAGIAYTLGDRESRDDTIRFGQEIKLDNGDDWYAERDIQRDDPILVGIVREMEWTIDEYDGQEWVAEKHRIWR
jgi:sucrose-6-phosphate hydrolase SacC (GH32 family)